MRALTKQLLFMLFFLAFIPSVYGACWTPFSGPNTISVDKTFCRGDYTVDGEGDPAFTIKGDSITVDCNMSNITGPGGSSLGFNITGDDVELKRCFIKGGYRAPFSLSSNGYIHNIQVLNGTEGFVSYGFILPTGSDNNVIKHFFINNTGYGFYLDGADGNNITEGVVGNVIENSYEEKDSIDNKVFLTHFWSKGVNAENTGFCVDTGTGLEGNFYDESIPEEDYGYNDCGPVNSTNLTEYKTYKGKLSFNWSRQSHMPTNPSMDFMYVIELSNNSGMSWKNIGNTTDTNFSFDTGDYSDGPNMKLRIRPFDGYNYAAPFYTSMFGVGRESSLLGYTYLCREDAEEAGQKVANVTVMSLGTPFKTRSDENGTYNLSGIPPGIHTIIAFKEGYRSKWNRTVDLFPREIENADFELCPIEKTCQADCTLLGSDRCEPSCDGIAGCKFNFDDGCQNLAKGTKVRHNSTHDAICCGHDYKYAKFVKGLNITVDAKDIVTLTKVINFRDQFKYLVGAKMKIIVFDKG